MTKSGTDERTWRERKRAEWGAFGGAVDYETRIGAYAQQVDHEVVTRLLAGSGRTILDLPCGAGRMSAAQAASRPQMLVSADYSTDMLVVARRRLHNPIVRCDAFALPFRDGSFDRVLMLRLVFHYADPEPLLREARRVLQPGGELVFDTLNPGSLRHAVERLLILLGRRRRTAGLSFMPPGAVRTVLARQGFEVAARSSRFLLPTRAYRFIPRAACRVFGALERVVPEGRRVLTYWRAVTPS